MDPADGPVLGCWYAAFVTAALLAPPPPPPTPLRDGLRHSHRSAARSTGTRTTSDHQQQGNATEADAVGGNFSDRTRDRTCGRSLDATPHNSTSSDASPASGPQRRKPERSATASVTCTTRGPGPPTEGNSTARADGAQTTPTPSHLAWALRAALAMMFACVGLVLPFVVLRGAVVRAVYSMAALMHVARVVQLTFVPRHSLAKRTTSKASPGTAPSTVPYNVPVNQVVHQDLPALERVAFTLSFLDTRPASLDQPLTPPVTTAELVCHACNLATMSAANFCLNAAAVTLYRTHLNLRAATPIGPVSLCATLAVCTAAYALSAAAFVCALYGVDAFYRLVFSVVLTRAIPSCMDAPWRSRTLSEFWGSRWNQAVGGQLRDVCFLPIARRGHPALGTLSAFAGSALLHATPFVVTGAPWTLAASMSLFFLLHGMLVLIERRSSQWLFGKTWTLGALFASGPLFVFPMLGVAAQVLPVCWFHCQSVGQVSCLSHQF
eukprot:m.457648 g.457648  ORF g.457648 m.457648 type:complete len:494 (+) comp20334_c0_seq1:6840-8321(+)